MSICISRYQKFKGGEKLKKILKNHAVSTFLYEENII